MKKLFTILLFAVSCNTYAQQLVTDPGFGNGSSNYYSIWYIPNKLLQQQDKKFLICGYDYGANNDYFNVIRRVSACGITDSSFGTNGIVYHTFDQRNLGLDYVLQPDGKILVAGTQASSNASSQQFPFVARYNINGTPDSTFGFFGTNKITDQAGSFFSSVFLQSNGKILCNNAKILMRFKSTGLVDSTFGTNGVFSIPDPPSTCLNCSYDRNSIMRLDGKIIIANLDGSSLLIYCIDSSGVVDSSFGTNGFAVPISAVIDQSHMIVQNDNKVIAEFKNTSSQYELVRFNTNGTLDLTFGTNGHITIPVNGWFGSFTKFPDDKFLVSCNDGPPVFNKYNADGTVDPDFSLNGTVNYNMITGGRVNVASASTNGEMILAGGWDISIEHMIVNSSVPMVTQSGSVLHSNVLNDGCTFQWFLNGGAINGATDSTLTVTANGTYTVEVTNIWGCSDIDDFVVTTVINNISNLNQISGVTVYPNPTTDFITLRNSSNKNISATVYEISGRLISALNINVGENIFSLKNYASGVYMIELKDGVSVSRIKIVKE